MIFTPGCNNGGWAFYLEGVLKAAHNYLDVDADPCEIAASAQNKKSHQIEIL
ncbi:hypothetical protein [Acuticoccus kandeliae]|uniref:hypothetical protein n=1 Tax=Acuticoccus kandeliae TaxID=2073160 RepID=UPI001FE9295C|nr:hypothetical protein [Acuticoccus kandeliae]